jgi:hypothetical protein
MRLPAPRLNPIPLVTALVSSLLVLCVLLAAGPGEVLAALPLILLLVALVFRHYPGERLIEKLAERLRPRRPRPVSSPRPALGAALRQRPVCAVLAVVRPLRGPPLLS